MRAILLLGVAALGLTACNRDKPMSQGYEH